MSRRQKIIIAVVLILLLLLGLAILFLRPTIQVVNQVDFETVVNTTPAGGFNSSLGANVNRRPVDTRIENVNAVPPPPAPPDDRNNLRSLAASFAERYGSFSNQGDYENLIELKAFMTAKMAAETDAYVEEQRSKGGPAPAYFGVTTRAISTEISELNEIIGTAKARVTTQRNEQTGSSPQGRVYYQDLMFSFVKEGDVWKVDEAIWVEP